MPDERRPDWRPFKGADELLDQRDLHLAKTLPHRSSAEPAAYLAKR